RFTQLHAANGAIITSDASYKVDVNDLTDAEKSVAIKLRSLVKKYRMRESVEIKGEKARWHIGIIAQEAIKAFEDEGLDAFSYGIICNSKWDNIYDDEGRLIKEAGSRYGVRYDELLCFIIASI
ncbi:tail fiber domain-containing protein, partial [Morganella morganii]